MKNKGAIITLIVLLGIIVIGLIVFLCMVLNGKHIRFGIGNWSKKSTNIIYDTTYELESIDNLEILSSAGNINFEESTDGKIRVVAYGKNENDIKVNYSNNKLKIDYSIHNHIMFGFNFQTNDIIVYIPSDYSKEIKLDLDYGDINMIDLENATINIKEDCGSIKLGKVKNTTVDSSYGDVKIDTILNKCKIDTDCGSVKIGSATINENSYIKVDLGDVKIGETNDIFIDTKVDLGDTKINTNNRHSDVTLKIEVDCGDIKVEN